MSVFICGTCESCVGAGPRRSWNDRLLAYTEAIDNGPVTSVIHSAKIVQ